MNHSVEHPITHPTNHCIFQFLRSYCGISILCAFFLFMGLLSLNQMIIYTPDSARYLVWANSLATLEGFKDATSPEITRYVVHAPLYSILLVPSAIFFPNSVVAAKIMTILFGCLAILLLFVWLRRKVGSVYALMGSLFLVLNPLMVIYSTQVLSDVPFAVCVILFFLLAEKLIENKSFTGTTEYVFIAVIVAGVLLREIGLTLMLAATLFFLWKKQYQRAALIFLVSLLIYSLWFIRNEIIVAGIENPPLRNSHYFFSRFYTSGQESFLNELGARLWNNLTIYSNLAGRLLFMPDYGQYYSMFVSSTDPFVAPVLKVLPVAKYFLVGISLVFIAVAVWHEARTSKTFSLMVIVLAWYLGLILFYPVNDIRFLFPLLIGMIYFFVLGVKQMSDRWRMRVGGKVLCSATIGLLLLLLLPNISWLQNFVWNSWEYAKSPEGLYEQLHRDPNYPEMFTKPLHQAAKWIVQHSDSSAVIFSYWKELALWLDGRKVIESNPIISPVQFDYKLRDYGVKYIVAIHWRSSLNELQTLFIQSERFAFVLVYCIGDIEVFEVKRKESLPEATLASFSIGSSYEEALHLLEIDPLKSEQMLKKLSEGIEGDEALLFYLGVAKEFAGQLDSAALLFKEFRSLSQGGAYMQKAWYHQDIISSLKRAESSVLASERAIWFQIVASHYWELGYRKQAMRILHRSLEADSNFVPSVIISAIFSFQLGDTLATRRSAEKARVLDPSNILVNGLTTLMRCKDSLQIITSQRRQIDIRLTIIKAYLAMGLRENAIDDLLKVLCEDSTNPKALRLLAETYEVKRRYAPALQMYRRLAMVSPSDSVANVKIRELSEHCR